MCHSAHSLLCVSSRSKGLFKREDYILQTKVSPDADPADFTKKMETSFSTLDLEGNAIGHVDLFAFHGVNSQRKLDWVLKPGKLLLLHPTA